MAKAKEKPARSGEILEAQRIPEDWQNKIKLGVAAIGVSVRTCNCLEEHGIFTLDDLLHCTQDELMAIENFGEKSLAEVFDGLETIGFLRARWRKVLSASPEVSE